MQVPCDLLSGAECDGHYIDNNSTILVWTATVCGLLRAPAELSVMAPEYVPAAEPRGIDRDDQCCGVVALAGETLSQSPEVRRWNGRAFARIGVSRRFQTEEVTTSARFPPRQAVHAGSGGIR